MWLVPPATERTEDDGLGLWREVRPPWEASGARGIGAGEPLPAATWRPKASRPVKPRHQVGKEKGGKMLLQPAKRWRFVMQLQLASNSPLKFLHFAKRGVALGQGNGNAFLQGNPETPPQWVEQGRPAM